jgi:nucleoid DNA-binding protein
MNLDELTKLVSKKSSISEAQARLAIDQVAAFLKKQLPAPIAAQIDSVLKGGSMSDLTKGIGGLFGGKK